MRAIVALCLISIVASVALMPQQKKTLKQKPNVFGIFCDICVSLVQTVEKDLTDDFPTIEKNVNAECDSVFGTGVLDSACKEVCDYYLEEVVADLKNGENAKDVCTSISFC
ncbi:unnamed protein product, partial [Mesorhabditis belari]|uniref:Saposin B-type domain-containing protein n=1 Tax=Mesorhabditis belari TaxID=2138241 RepID=A0AAF3J8D1_9BILA